MKKGIGRKHRVDVNEASGKKSLSLLFSLLLVFSVTFAHAQQSDLVFSSLLARGTDFHSMAFDGNGNLYFIGWNAALEKAPAFSLPNPPGNGVPISKMQDYLSFFAASDAVTEVLDVNGASIGFDSLGFVYSYLWAAG
jgi:hypothetical protein